MFRTNIIFSCLAMLAFAGCLTNNYEKFYVDYEGSAKTESKSGDAPVTLRMVTTEEDVIALIEDGYQPIGTSSFSGRYTPFSCAVDCAEKHGAALVLLDVRYKSTKEYTSVMYLPSTSTTYHYGTVNAHATAYGPGGIASANGYGTYSGTSTTTTMNAVPVQRSVDVYDHDAMFFKKIDISSLYGVVFDMPKRLPGESVADPIKVRIKAVYHGSKAERDGIHRGSVVAKINGVDIKTRKDIEQFLQGRTRINKMEVEK